MYSLRSSLPCAVGILAIALFSPASLHAQTNTWQASGNGNWSLAGNWSQRKIPDGSDGVFYDILNNGSYTITHSSSTGTNGIDIINSYQNSGTGGLTLSGGTLMGAQANAGSLFQSKGTVLDGGTLNNFTLVNSSALSFTKGNNALKNISLDSGLSLNGGFVQILNGLSYTSGSNFSLAGSQGGLEFSTNFNFAHANLSFGSSANPGNISADSSHTLTLDSSLNVTGTNTDFRGGTLINNALLSSSHGGGWSFTPTTLTNNATMEARNTSSLLSVSGGQFTNGGIFQAANGGNASISVTALSNTGTFQALSGGHLSISGFRTYPLGTVTADGAGSIVTFGGFNVPNAYIIRLGQGENLSATNGGSLRLRTTLDNTGQTFDPDAYGSKSGFSLNGGTIQNGTIANSDDLHFFGDITMPDILQNVTLSGGLNLAATQGSAQIQGTFHYGPNAIFNLGQDSSFNFVGNSTLDNATVQTHGGELGISSGTLTLGQNLTIQGSGNIGPYVYAGGTLVNNTTIAAAGSGGQWSIQTYKIINNGIFQATSGGYFVVSNASTLTNAGQIGVDASSSMALPTYVQTGGLTQADGFLNITSADSSGARALALQGGTFSGTGNVSGEVVNTGGTVHPGLKTLSIGGGGYGNYTQGVNGIFQEDISSTLYGCLAVGETANLNGSLDVSLLNGFAPKVGDQFAFLTYGAETGTFASIFSTTSGYDFSVAYLPTEALLTVTKAPAAVPEASTTVSFGLLLALSMGGVMIVARKKKAAAPA